MRLPARLIPPDRLGCEDGMGDRGPYEDFPDNSRDDKSRSRARIAKTNKNYGNKKIRNTIE